MGVLRGVVLVWLVVLLWGAGTSASARGLEPFSDLQIQSIEDVTLVRFVLPADHRVEDETKLQPGRVAVETIRFVFPETRVERSRLITVNDRNVEEARLFPGDRGVILTVAVRRPVTYTVSRQGGAFRLQVRPGTLRLPTVDLDEIDPTAAPRAEGPREATTRALEGDQGLAVDAETITYDEDTGEIVARGRVTIARAESLLTADEVRINRETNQAQAIGNVELTDAQGRLQTERFYLDLDDETGELENARIFLAENSLTVTGRRLEKGYGQTYRIEDGTFTTCRCGAGPPTWSIAGDEVEITLDGYGVARDATFRLYDLPVFYVPWMVFPAKTTRQTGLLTPQIGYSENRGFLYQQPLYVVFNKSADATVSVDVETSARVGGIAEYRYALGPRSTGAVNFAYFNESIRDDAEDDIVNTNVADPSIPENRWSLTANAGQELPGELRAFVDALVVSDDFYLREIPTFSFDPVYERTLRTSRFAVSRGGVYRFWERTTLIGQVQYFQDFIQDDDLTLQRLPQVNLFSSERFLDRRVKVQFQGEAVNFARSEGTAGPRLDLSPEIGVPFRWREYFRGWGYLGFRETAYHLTENSLVPAACPAGTVRAAADPETGDPVCVDPEDLDEEFAETVPPIDRLPDDNPTRELFFVNVQTGTELYRIFDVSGDYLLKLKHTIEPAVDYLFIPDVDQDDLPAYDFVDRINERNLFSYGFTSRLLAKVQGVEESPYDVRALGGLHSFGGTDPAAFGQDQLRWQERELERERDEEEDVTTGLTGEGLPTGAEEEPSSPEDDAAIVEWARFSLFQSYSLDESLRRERDDQFSDVDVALRLTPASSFSLGFDASIDARENEFTAANVGVRLQDPRPRVRGGFFQAGPPASVGLTYRFQDDDVLEEIFGSVLLPLADSLSAFYQGRYDVLEQDFLENLFGFRLSSQCQCWIAHLFVADRINPDETEVRAQLTLIGLGSVGRDPFLDQRRRR